MISSELASHSSLVVAPGRDAVAAEDARRSPAGSPLDRGDVEAELEAGPAPRHPDHLVAEALLGQRLAVGSGRERDAGVRVQVVDVGGLDEPVHRGVDRRGRSARAVQAVVERGDHLVLALDAGVDVRRARAAGRAAARRGPASVSVPRSPPDPFTHSSSTGSAGDRVGLGPLGGGVAPGVVGVARIGAQPVGPGEQVVRPSGHARPIRPGCRRRGRPRSAPGSRCRRRQPSGRRAGRCSSRQPARSARTSV